MNVVILSTSEFGIAPNRLYKALQKKGVNVKMLVKTKLTDDNGVISINTSKVKEFINFIRFVWERLIIFFNNKFNYSNLFKVSIANTGTDLSKHPLITDADIIHIHWINQGFLSLKDIDAIIKTNKTVIWTMHDMWVCTGICHHSWGCENYTNDCGCCPLLHSKNHNDLSHKVLKTKQFIFQPNIHIVTVSSWLKSIVNKSSITKNLNVSVIPNVIDLNIFSPEEKEKARRSLNLPLNIKIVLMGAIKIDDPIKGFSFLKQAMEKVYKENKDVALALFGNIKDKSIIQGLSFPVFSIDLIKNPRQIAQLYSAADVNVLPSYYETFGQTIIEAMACGCPSVSFNNSGQTDIIDHKINGYLAQYEDVDDLAKGIIRILYEANYSELAANAQKKAAGNYSEDIVAERYIKLYDSILK